MNLPRRQLSLIDLQAHAEKLGGHCHSDQYLGLRSSYSWECRSGHRWDANGRMVLDGTWCQECRSGSENWISKLQSLAKSKGGRCLSPVYLKSSVPLSWECGFGHKWEARPNNIVNGTWCPTCSKATVNAGRRRTIEGLKAIATKRGGACLADSLISSNEKILWQCRHGHQWQATPKSVVGAKNWCPECGKARNQKKLADQKPQKLVALQKLAKARGGFCLSTEYARQVSPLKWQCGNGHEWLAQPSNILRGGWCPECASGLGERICRSFFEQIFNAEFPKTRPLWLKSERGTLLELDGYSDSLKLAFEHQGAYHYRVEKRYSKDEIALGRRKKEDAWKQRLCIEHGVVLVVIPEVPSITSIKALKKFILDECQRQGVTIPSEGRAIQIDFSDAYRPVPAFKLIFRDAKDRGGRLISPLFLGWANPLQWECGAGQQWTASPGSVYQQRTWCPRCAGVQKKTINEMQGLARARGGKCLSTDYINSHGSLTWECSSGHRWDAAPTNIVSKNSWCPYCSGQKGAHLGLKAMKDHANALGGECLSVDYKNSKTKLRWLCSEGHEWDAMPLNVIHKNSWCPTCANKKKGRRS